MNTESPFHPACLLLPEVDAEAFRELVEDLRNHGQRHPIIIDEHGVVLDGRHRLRALRELFVEPRIETFHGTEAEKVALVMSENVHRRHLTVQQRAAVAAELAPMRHGGDRSKASVDALTDAQAAKLMGVSEPSVERAKKRMRADPEAHRKAKAGTLGRKQPQSKPQKMRRQWDAMRRGWAHWLYPWRVDACAVYEPAAALVYAYDRLTPERHARCMADIGHRDQRRFVPDRLRQERLAIQRRLEGRA
jgi:ParB-like chromosome segregation protein Spo0J